MEKDPAMKEFFKKLELSEQTLKVLKGKGVIIIAGFFMNF